MSNQRCHSLSSFTDAINYCRGEKQDSQTESRIDDLGHSPGAPSLLVGCLNVFGLLLLVFGLLLPL